MKCFRTLVCLAAALLPMQRLQAQAVVTDWNTIASTTIVTNGGKASVASGVWCLHQHRRLRRSQCRPQDAPAFSLQRHRTSRRF